MKILIDNGHGEDTAGKRSPDGKFREYLFNRDVAIRLEAELISRGYDAECIVPESRDISLVERVRRVNEYCNKLGKDNVILISIHCDAFGNGEWNDARGWAAWTSVGKTHSDDIAECLYDAAEVALIKYAETFSPKRKHIRTDLKDGDRDYEAQFYILRKTICPAVLTENCFMTNKDDVAWLSQEKNRELIARLHADGIELYFRKHNINAKTK